MNIPTSNNKAYGFFGAVSTAAQSDDVADLAWSIAVPTIAEATGEDFETVAAFLDSRSGQHFADDVMGAVDASDSMEECVAAAVAKWQGWSVSGRTRREHDIPAGTNYLAAFVRIEGAAE